MPALQSLSHFSNALRGYGMALLLLSGAWDSVQAQQSDGGSEQMPQAISPNEGSGLSRHSQYFVNDPDAKKYAVILTGPGVGEVNQERFRRWSFSLHDILGRDYGYSSDDIYLIFNRGADADNPADGRIDAACDREGIESQIALLADRVAPGDQVTFYMIGHGSGADENAKFNIVGPDILGSEFAGLLDRFNEQDVIVINSTSASYSFAASLSAERRVVISATRSPSEKYDTLFSDFFIGALDNRAGDADKNERVSVLEAFNFARNSVAKWYEDQGRLAAEHPGLDDNGDALFSLAPSSQEADGWLAEIAYIDTLQREDQNLSARALELKSKMQEVERSVFILRSQKADYLENDYWRQMEQLLVELARTTASFDRETK